jgi:uncharacterized protein YdeI (YjbR/CyaY-like superfamily)
LRRRRRTARWNALDHVESFTVPDDFQKALAEDKAARAGFDAALPVRP